MRAARVDANHRLIVAAARRAGLRVYNTAKVGGGFPDLVVQYGRRVTELWEVKDPAKSPSRRKLTLPQKALRDEGMVARTVMTVADVAHARRDMVKAEEMFVYGKRRC